MAFIVENLRLKELAIVAEQNRPAFDDFVGFLRDTVGYPSLYDFISDQNDARALDALRGYFHRPFPDSVSLYDGIARPYAGPKAKWLLVGWILRDAPEQRLRPMIASMPGNSAIEKQIYLLNEVRKHASTVFPHPYQWEWTPICEVIIDRLEGSRRAIKGTLFEVIVRRNLGEIFKATKTELSIHPTEVRLGGETYDVQVSGNRGSILLPVKTRETMGGGHAGLFTRDIHKSVGVAETNGYVCLPIVIAESWVADLQALACNAHIYINKNPNQVIQVEPLLAAELARHLPIFQAIA